MTRLTLAIDKSYLLGAANRAANRWAWDLDIIDEKKTITYIHFSPLGDHHNTGRVQTLYRETIK